MSTLEMCRVGKVTGRVEVLDMVFRGTIEGFAYWGLLLGIMLGSGGAGGTSSCMVTWGYLAWWGIWGGGLVSLGAGIGVMGMVESTRAAISQAFFCKAVGGCSADCQGFEVALEIREVQQSKHGKGLLMGTGAGKGWFLNMLGQCEWHWCYWHCQNECQLQCCCCHCCCHHYCWQWYWHLWSLVVDSLLCNWGMRDLVWLQGKSMAGLASEMSLVWGLLLALTLSLHCHVWHCWCCSRCICVGHPLLHITRSFLLLVNVFFCPDLFMYSPDLFMYSPDIFYVQSRHFLLHYRPFYVQSRPFYVQSRPFLCTVWTFFSQVQPSLCMAHTILNILGTFY